MKQISRIELQKAAKIKYIVQIPVKDRTLQHQQDLISLIKTYKLFDHLSVDENLQKICQKMYIKTIKPGQTLFEQPFDKENIYLILVGFMQMQVKFEDIINKSYTFKSLNDFHNGQYFWYDKDNMDFQNGQTVFTAQEETDVLVIQQQFFNESSKNIQQKSMDLKLDFLKTYDFFKDTLLDQLKQFSSCLKWNNYESNTILLQQGDYVGNIFFIYEGEVKLVKNVLMKKVFLPQLENLHEIVQKPQKNDPQESKLFELEGLGPKTILGLNNMLNKTVMQHSVVTQTSVKVLEMNKQIFNNLDQQIVQALKKYKQWDNSDVMNVNNLNDELIRTQFYLQKNWQIYKNSLINQFFSEKNYEKKQFDGVLRKEQRIGWKKDVFVPDSQAFRKMNTNVTFPPVNQINNKNFKTFYVAQQQADIDVKKTQQFQRRLINLSFSN